MPDQREQAIEYIKTNGPALPVQIGKKLDTSILFASAILSELVSRKLLLISSKNVGGSPLYFLQGQEEKVCSKLHGSLKAQEKDLVKEVQEKKVLHHNHLEPWQRISVEQLKDFFVPLDVTLENQQYRFWKYKPYKDQELREAIQSFFENHKEPEKTTKEEPMEQTNLLQDYPAQKEEKVETLSEKRGDTSLKEELDIEQLKADLMMEMKKELLKNMQTQKKVQQQIQEKPKKKLEGKLYEQTCLFFKKHEIEILGEEELRKGELDFTIKIPSNIGHLTFYAKIKDKKVINEGDISAAFSDGQLKQLPVLFISPGKLTKKAEELLQTKLKNQMTFKIL